jgi:hypothetical protein
MIKMISFTHLYRTLKGCLIFRKMSPSRSIRLNKKIQKKMSYYKRTGYVPKSQLKLFVRANLTHSIGNILADKNLTKISIHLETNPELKKAWFETPKSLEEYIKNK